MKQEVMIWVDAAWFYDRMWTYAGKVILPFVDREWIDNNIEPWWKLKIYHTYLYDIVCNKLCTYLEHIIYTYHTQVLLVLVSWSTSQSFWLGLHVFTPLKFVYKKLYYLHFYIFVRHTCFCMVDKILNCGMADSSSNLTDYKLFFRVLNVSCYSNNFLKRDNHNCLRSEPLFKNGSEFLPFIFKICGIYVIYIKNNHSI